MIEYELLDDIEYRLWRQWCNDDPWNPNHTPMSQADFAAFIQTKVPGAIVIQNFYNKWTIKFADPKDLTIFLLRWA